MSGAFATIKAFYPLLKVPVLAALGRDCLQRLCSMTQS